MFYKLLYHFYYYYYWLTRLLCCDAFLRYGIELGLGLIKMLDI